MSNLLIKILYFAMYIFVMATGAMTWNIFKPGAFTFAAMGWILWAMTVSGAVIFLVTTLAWAAKIPFEATKKWNLIGFTSLGVTLFAVWQLSIRHDIVNHPNLSGLVALMAIIAILSAISHWNDIVRQKHQRIGK